MTAVRSQEIRRTSIRVALAATAVVAVAYLIVAVAVAAIFTRNQTGQIDTMLMSSLQHPHVPNDGGGRMPPPDADSPGGLPVLSWLILPDGSVENDSGNSVSLPDEYRTVTSPQDASIDGVDWRLAGRPVQLIGVVNGAGYYIVGQSLQPLAQARGTVVVAEVLIAPILLLIVFLGAVTIGRRVATPIERARQRQLEFSADASHELRTPLSVIEAQTSLALAQERSNDWYRTAFGRVEHESRRMRRLVEDLLWLARFDATQRMPTAEPVDLGVLAAQAADRFAVIAEARGLRLQVTAPGAGLVVGAPPEWLDRLLGVLIDNACKYSPDHGAVAIAVSADRGRVTLTVDDAGPGIPENERGRIFDRFHRATEAKSGAGLGLAIADAVVRATGGQWHVGRAPSGGARMAVSWPQAAVGPRTAAGPSRARVEAAPSEPPPA